MTAPSLVEEVAEAICLEAFGYRQPMSPDMDIARAAIAVVLRRMEQPSKGMLGEAREISSGPYANDANSRVWGAMLAAFRKENGVE